MTRCLTIALWAIGTAPIAISSAFGISPSWKNHGLRTPTTRFLVKSKGANCRQHVGSRQRDSIGNSHMTAEGGEEKGRTRAEVVSAGLRALYSATTAALATVFSSSVAGAVKPPTVQDPEITTKCFIEVRLPMLTPTPVIRVSTCLCVLLESEERNLG